MEHLQTTASGFFHSFRCFLSPSKLIKTSFFYFLNMFYQEFRTWGMNIINLNDTVVAAWKHTFIGDITWNLAVFCWLINVYRLCTYWISVLQKQPPEVFCKNRACNFIKKETLAQAFSCEFFKISKSIFLRRTTPGDCFLYSTVLQSFT